MDDVDKELEEQKTTLQDLRFFMKKFEGNNTGVGLAESMKKITSRPMNKSNRHHLNSSMEQLNNNRRINMLVKQTQVLILLLQVWHICPPSESLHTWTKQACHWKILKLGELLAIQGKKIG